MVSAHWILAIWSCFCFSFAVFLWARAATLGCNCLHWWTSAAVRQQVYRKSVYFSHKPNLPGLSECCGGRTSFCCCGSTAADGNNWVWCNDHRHAVTVCGDDLSKISFIPTKMREHLSRCMENKLLTPFPVEHESRMERTFKYINIEVSCECKTPDNY